MIVPRGTDYTEQDYLRDATTAFGRKLRHTQRIYWPPYGGVKIPMTIGRAVKYVLVTGLIVTFVVLWAVARF